MMNLSPEKMRKIVEESVLSVQPADVKKYHGKSIPVGPQKLSSMKEKQIVNATGGFAAGCDREEIAVFCDGTLTSNGKKGLLFSLKGFYSAELNMFRKKSPLKLPVCYEELERVDEKKDEIYFYFKGGQVANGYGSVYSGFIVEALSRILRGIAAAGAEAAEQEPAAAPEQKPEPEADSAAQRDQIPEAASQMEDLFGCLWVEERSMGKKYRLGGYSVYFLDFAENRRYKVSSDGIPEELFREGKVYFARARRNGSNGFPVVAEVLPRRQLYLNMLPEEFTDAHYVFADCEAEGRRYRIHREFFRRSEGSLKLLGTCDGSAESRQVVLEASNYAGHDTAHLEPGVKFL